MIFGGRRFEDNGTTTWRWRGQAWRCQFKLFIHRHRYPLSTSDRWVFQPSFTYDRKHRGAA